MIEAKASALESLRLENLQELLRSPGPCITVLLPPYRPGEQAKSAATLLKSGLQEATHQLAAAKVPDGIAASLLAPLRDLNEDRDLAIGSHCGRIMFSAPGVFRQFHMTEPVQASLTVASSFQIRGILTELHLPPEFYLLKVSQKAVELLRCSEFRAEPAPLPKGVASTLEEALALEPPDHDLENRSASGSGTGAMRGVRFGTGSGRETQHAYFADFYRKVDRGLGDFLRPRKAALVLVGVNEDTVMYHSVATYPGLLKHSVHGNAKGFLHEADMLRQAYDIARDAIMEREAKELAESQEKLGPARFLQDLKKILDAAFEGRLQRVYLSANAAAVDRFEGFGYRSVCNEDLANLAAVQTIVHGGDAVALPAARMPKGANFAGVLRF